MTTTTRLRPGAGRDIAPFTRHDISLAGPTPTVHDLVLAERLGFAKPSSIRDLIKRNREELEAFGPLPRAAEKSTGGRPGCAFRLNRQQAMLLSILAKTSVAAQVRRQMIEVFDAVAAEAVPSAACVAPPARQTAEEGTAVTAILERVGITSRPASRSRTASWRASRASYATNA